MGVSEANDAGRFTKSVDEANATVVPEKHIRRTVPDFSGFNEAQRVEWKRKPLLRICFPWYFRHSMFISAIDLTNVEVYVY